VGHRRPGEVVAVVGWADALVQDADPLVGGEVVVDGHLRAADGYDPAALARVQPAHVDVRRQPTVVEAVVQVPVARCGLVDPGQVASPLLAGVDLADRVGRVQQAPVLGPPSSRIPPARRGIRQPPTLPSSQPTLPRLSVDKAIRGSPQVTRHLANVDQTPAQHSPHLM
jgi:hypothetical protein